MNKIIVAAIAVSCSLPIFAKVELATPFANHMVLQRDREVPVWGTASPGEKVTVEFAGKKVSTKAKANGRWIVKLPKMKASKESRILKANDAIVKDVLVGEVWLCSGQSNADCPIWGNNPHYRERWGAAFLQMTMKPFVRIVRTSNVASTKPLYNYKAWWRAMTPQSLGLKDNDQYPSAVGYLFALELANALDIPIGLIDSSWGGTNIDAWIPKCGYEGIDSLKDIAALPVYEEAEFQVARSNGVYSAKNMFAFGQWIQQPNVLWNGMVVAYAPMACRGFIWYQGCHNAGEYQRYCDKLHALYNGWAKSFANPDMKMYFAQLSSWKNYANIQMAQAKFETEEPNAAMAVISDVGNTNDIHPNDKYTVAKRLAMHALKRDYGFDWLKDNSPTLKDWRIEGDKFVLSFNDAESWYLYNTDWTVSNRFEVAGADGKWVPAKIRNKIVGEEESGKAHGKCKGVIVGKDLEIGADGVTEPKQLRYLHNSPWMGNLYNESSLPLGAFIINSTDK